ncbi:MAG: 50S ribosomal protein L3 [SAR202 cluster bacterium]|nr:50S ribosomal protein L3 [Chloroflexota bacterium]MQG39541.1 50S ribosomal protein L3 [SAR202 cluster bacterium]|tara:strand:+ start:1221 stop:1847 length:627 start_codon:yes stop_codon:yes gene_type:complete
MTLNALLGKKIGTTRHFHEDGRADCVTAIELGPCAITQIKGQESEGYNSVQIGYGSAKNLNKAQNGHLKKSEKTFKFLKEIRDIETSELEVGQQFDLSIFEVGSKLDITGVTKGRGFAGGVKRHGFKGGPKTHGQSDRHRAPGSIGAGSTPGRVLKGMKMAGHMGSIKVTIKNLEILSLDQENNVLMVKGAVPGSTGTLLYAKKSKKQ